LRAFFLLSQAKSVRIHYIDEIWAANSSINDIDGERNKNMKRFFTLEYWEDDNWFVGKLREIPGVFSQGKTVEELKENIIDAYRMMVKESEVEAEHADVKYIELGVEV